MAKALKSFSAPISNGALKADELPSRIKFLNWGANKTLDGDIFLDDESLSVFYANQKSIGRALVPLDFNHNTVPGTQAYKADKEPRAVAAYGVPTIVPGEGMYFDYLQWTPSGVKSARDYADLSPTVLLDDSKRVIGLHSCALTPAGSIENLCFYSADDTLASIMGQLKAYSTDADKDDDAKEDGEEDKDKDKDKKDMKACSADVEYADTKNHKYPISTEEHVRAAWSYIHMPRNQKSYATNEVEDIKQRIAAKAKHYGIELRAENADSYRHLGMGQANAYVQDPYKGIDAMLDESLEYFRNKLGMADGAKPDDIMKALRAHWEGLEADKEPLPTKAAGSSTDPEDRGHGNLAEKEEPESKRMVIAYNAELSAKLAALEAKLTPLSAELTTLKTERNEAAQRAEKTERDAIVVEASRVGKVIPLSAEEIAETPIKMLRSIVDKLPANTVPMTSKTATLKALSADGSIPPVTPGSRQRAAEVATRMFADLGIHSQGPQALGGSR